MSKSRKKSEPRECRLVNFGNREDYKEIFKSTLDSPKRQRRQRPVALMAVDVVHRGAPEVVLQDAGPRVLGEHVLVPHHRGYIVVHEITT